MSAFPEPFTADYSTHLNSEKGVIVISRKQYEKFNQRYERVNTKPRRIAGKCPEVGIYILGGIVMHNCVAHRIRLIHDKESGLEKLAEEFGLL